ncbi:hypothetical protein PTTG_07440 [Puccinia triticina 1-1 BBBD Race 1]|uniref:Uncharacterized protein n=1 Tax=Puccinia triticina (isolate 1-1 / race 1 (BBBD)) TaxID=630390 RepID=A0A0C4F2W8_PUCT1|nr:hypothetical protein PTTG_07440 [Puccinia triticina 1-1 BBBD Race 1]
MILPTSPQDPSTGLAPFVYPLPPLSTVQLPRVAWIPLAPLALFRTAFLVILGVVFVIFETSTLIFSLFSVKFHSAFQYYCTAVFGRIALYLMGFTQLPSDPPFTRRNSSQKLISTPVRPGDLVVCNWSSYVDVIYLAYLYNPIFILPVVKDRVSSPGQEFLFSRMLERIETSLETFGCLSREFNNSADSKLPAEPHEHSPSKSDPNLTAFYHVASIDPGSIPSDGLHRAGFFSSNDQLFRARLRPDQSGC